MYFLWILHWFNILDQPLSHYEPSPRFSANASASTDKLYIHGGVVDNFNNNKIQLKKVVQIYECSTESWKEHATTGTPPPGIYGCATAYSDHILYLFGGHDGNSFHASLHQLDIRSMTWSQLSPHDSGPMRKCYCQMIHYNNTLFIIGGWGIPSGELQSGSQFIESTFYRDGRGRTNEIHMCNISQSKF